MKVYPTKIGGTTEGVVYYLIQDFQEIVEISSKHISRVLLSDLATLLMDFVSHWVESPTEASGGQAISTAAKTLITLLTFYFRDLGRVSCPSVFFQVYINI